MAQRHITSFFTKTPKKESDDQTTRDTDKQREINGKRKREDSSNRSGRDSKSSSKKIEKSPNLKPIAKKEKKNKTQSSPRNNGSEKKKNKTPTSTNKNKKKAETSKFNQKLVTKKNETDVEEILLFSDNPDTNIEEVNSEPESPKEVTPPKKRRSRIIRPIDSSDDEGHLPLLDSPNKPDTEKEKDSSDMEQEDESDEKTEKKKSKDSKSVNGNISPQVDSKKSSKLSEKEAVIEEKPVKKVHSFFESKKKSEGEKSSETNAEKKKSSTHSYDPSKKDYHPILDAYWKKGDKVPYIALTRTLELIEDTSARLKIIGILANYLRSVIVLSPNDLLPSIYLCLNQLAPAYDGIELGVADTNLMKAIAQCTGRTLAQIKADVQEIGDLGLVAEGSRSNQRTMFQPAPLTVNNVYTKLKEIAMMTGQSSVSKKLDKIQSLFVACRFTEARYLIRSLAGKLRIGLAEQSLLQAMALACAMTPPEQQDYPPEILNAKKNMSSDTFKQKYDEITLILKTTYCECPNYDKIVPVILKEGVKALPSKCKITPGIPMKPMLAHPTKGVQEVLTRFDGLKFTCEWKYDGERAQIHVAENGDISIYSRNQENNTTKYPDVINKVKNTLQESVKSCILDCEAVAWDDEKKQILPFQVLSTRKRKDANEADIKVQVCVFMFDLLYLNGESLVKKPFVHRRDLLKKHFKVVESEWQFATSLDTTTMEEVQDFLEESVKGNCEGLMVKTLEEEATYEIAKRSRNWLKLKKDYLDGVGDTLDVVVLGGFIGKGKRTGTYGGFLLACYDKENEEYQSICKIGTGFSEEDLQKHSEFFKEHITSQPKSYYRFDSNQAPDHWFEPVQVWEIKCADLSLSPVHKAGVGLIDPEKGISLRFPRFIRVREDKNCEDATSARQVADLYNSQEQIKNQSGSNKINEEDFY
ncbi:DNA ligase 1 isoform X2 [Prorops nasuta]|uniref:DNA ligase 1 isoform X2 n=1 Tax=Prorops nasuta TaxID=863751 RepID=UPI0034CF2B02